MIIAKFKRTSRISHFPKVYFQRLAFCQRDVVFYRPAKSQQVLLYSSTVGQMQHKAVAFFVFGNLYFFIFAYSGRLFILTLGQHFFSNATGGNFAVNERTFCHQIQIFFRNLFRAFFAFRVSRSQRNFNFRSLHKTQFSKTVGSFQNPLLDRLWHIVTRKFLKNANRLFRFKTCAGSIPQRKRS